MRGSPNAGTRLLVIAVLAVLTLFGLWHASPSAAAPGPDLQPSVPEAIQVTLLADADTTLKLGFPNANFGGADSLDLEFSSGGRAISRVLLHFNLSAVLPTGTVINSAQLQVRLNSGTGVSPVTVRASTVTSDWGEFNVTWDTAPSTGDPTTDAQVVTAQAWYTWDVTAIAQSWQSGRNYGLELRGPESGADWYRTFRSRNPGEAEPRLVVTYSYQETTPPSNPTSFTADHFVNQWSNSASINGHWDGASDGSGSGVYGYSVEWNGSPATVPDTVVETTTNSVSHALANGSWYLHVRTSDVAGNWNAGASHFGPYKIDTTTPTDPTLASPSHTAGAWTTNLSVQMSWSGASDGAGSGVAGYSILWDAAASTTPDTTVDTTGSTAASSRPDGITYFHLRTKDVAGNWTSTVHFGPVKIDTAAPTNPHVFAANHTINQWSNNATLSGHWDDASDGAGSGIYGYSVDWTGSPTTVPDSVVDTTANQGSRQLAEGSWYLHVRTRDVVGNWSVGTAHFGPYKIDTTPPENPTITSGSHAVLLWSTNPAVQVSWSGASDGAGSGVSGYSILWDATKSTVPDLTVETYGNTASSTRPDGETYFHLRTKDVAGNWSTSAYIGPFGIDTQPPETITDLEVSPATYASVHLTWKAPADAGSGADQYDARFSKTPINASNWAAATPLTSLPQPGTPGAEQGVSRSSLKNGDTWYFAIKSRDRVGNWSAISNVRNILDLGLRPDFYGYPFGNYGDTQPSDLTAEDLALLLGHDEVCWPLPAAPNCTPYPNVPNDLSAILKASTGGHCLGFTVTSLRFLRQAGSPPSAYQSGAAKPIDLLKPSARRHIMYYWTKQLYNPGYSARTASYAASATQNVAKLQAALSGYQLDPLDMHIWHKDAGGTSGHSILPYALEDRGSGVWRVWVYDNNAPNAMNRFAEINTGANTWSYGGWGGGCGSAGNSMGLVPMSIYALTPDDVTTATIFTSLLTPAAGSAGIWLAGGAGHLLVTDPQGRRIGYLGNGRVNEIPGARADDILGGLDTPVEPIYTVPAGPVYRILLTGTTASAGDLSIVLHKSNRNAVSVEGLQLTIASRDELTVDAGGAGLAYRAGRAAGAAGVEPAAVEQPTLTLALTGATEGYRLQIGEADVAVGQAVALSADLAAGRLILDGSETGAGSFDLVVERSSSAGVRRFVHHDVPLAGGDTLIAQFGAWDGQGAMTVQVDHGSDGTVDETWTLDNQMSERYLPTISWSR